jgi:tRNA threonylcarbamoyladenosine biosynthesis protein TsaB
MIVLGLDASTYAASVALVRDGLVLAERDVVMRGADEERLFPAVLDVLTDGGVAITEIDRLVCGSGPGSFTSLRIAASIAKGLARSLDAPLYAVPSALLLAAGAEPALSPGRYLVVLDAMRGDVYAQRLEVGGSRIAPEGATFLAPRAAAQSDAESHGALVIGPDETPRHVPHARGVSALGTMLPWPEPVSRDSWEPAYGRLAEAQVVWERTHGRALGA